MAENDDDNSFIDPQYRQQEPTPIRPGDGTLEDPSRYVATPDNPNPPPRPAQAPGNNPYQIREAAKEAPRTPDGQHITDELVLPNDADEPLFDFQMIRTYIRAASQQAEKEVAGNDAAVLGALVRNLDKLDATVMHGYYLRWLDDLKEAEEKARQAAQDNATDEHAAAKSVRDERQSEMDLTQR